MIKKNLKKAVAVSMVAAMTATSLFACTKEDDKGTDSNNEGTKAEDKGTDSGKPVEAEKMEAPSTDGWDESKKIKVYSWNDELGNRLAVVLEKYPQFKDYYEYVNLGVSGTGEEYRQKIDALLEAGAGADYPSIIATDNDVTKYYTETDNVLDVEAIGITKGMYANAYQYTVDFATYNGKLKALTWQATPGNFVYRASIAKEVLGTDDPAKVQEYVKDWDTFFATADKMKEKGYKMLSGADDVKYAIWDQQTSPWVTDNKLTLDASVTEYFETAKKLYDGGYTDQTLMWDAAWSANFEEGDVFGYFGCTWFVYWSIAYAKNDDGTPKEGSSYGDWRVCVGPVGYHWGGSYVMAMKECPNTELAAFLMYSLCCDEEVMYNIFKKDSDFVNNKAAIAKAIEDGVGASGILGGQNPAEAWAEAALKIDLSNATYMDATLKGYMDKASEAYNNGTYKTVEEAIQYVKDQVKENYSYITVE